MVSYKRIYLSLTFRSNIIVYKLIALLPLMLATLTLFGAYATIKSLWTSFAKSSPAESEFVKEFTKAGFKHAASKL
jgi:hypothetical protein